MIAIYKRELKAYLHSPLGYLFIGLSLFIGGFFFAAINLANGMDALRVFLGSYELVIIFLVPLITMRLISEERRAKTDQLLLTSPVSSIGIVLGKYLAALTIFAINFGIMLIYPAILLMFGQPPISEMIVVSLGFFLMVAALVAVGTFASSLSESQIISAVIAFSITLFIWFLDALSAIFPGGFMLAFLDMFSIQRWLNEFLMSEISLPAVIYFLSVIDVFLLLTVMRIDKKFLNRRGKRPLIAAGIIVVVIVFNMVIQAFLPLRADLTHARIFSITPETRTVLADLEDEITLTFYHTPDSRHNFIIRILQRYERETSKIVVQYQSPALAWNPEIRDGTLVVARGEQERILQTRDMIDNEGFLIAEHLITNAIISVTAEDLGTLGIVTGRGGSMEQFRGMVAFLAANGIETEEVNIALGAISETIDVLLVVNPYTDFTEGDIQLLDEFLQNGGAMQVYLDIGISTPENLIAYLAESWGIEFQHNAIFERDPRRHFDQFASFIVPIPSPFHPITAPFVRSNTTILAPNTREVTIVGTYDEEVFVANLLASSETSYAKSDLESTEFRWEEGDLEGPFDVAVVAFREDEYENPIASVLAGGTTGIFEWNPDFFINALNWQMNSGGMLTIRPRLVAPGALEMNALQFWACVILVMVIIPLTVFGFGIYMWIKRRKL